MDLEVWALGGNWVRGGAIMREMSTLIKETQRASLLLLSVYELGQRPSSDTEFAGILIFDFLELGEINLCCISLWGPWNPKGLR